MYCLFWFYLNCLLKKTLLENVLEKEIRKRKEKKRREEPWKLAQLRLPLPPLFGQARPSFPSFLPGPAPLSRPVNSPAAKPRALSLSDSGDRAPPFSHRQHGPTRQPTPSPPSFLPHRNRTGDHRTRNDTEIPVSSGSLANPRVMPL